MRKDARAGNGEGECAVTWPYRGWPEAVRMREIELLGPPGALNRRAPNQTLIGINRENVQFNCRNFRFRFGNQIGRSIWHGTAAP